MTTDEHPSDHLTSALASRYAIEREIGRGGMATVYLAEDLKHKRKVAIKVLRPELAAALGAQRFLREIEVTANLQHPHILPLYDSGSAEAPSSDGPPLRRYAEFIYYVMPYVDGESLRQRLNRETQLPIEEALEITEQVASALDYAHRHDVIHRDIKPENILLQEGLAMVADFGIALAVKAAGGERLTETGLSLGTPAYMSPEQVAGEREIDARSDIYSLACVVFEMLAGEPPFTGPNAQAVLARHMTDPPPPVTTVRSAVPAPMAAAIAKALGKAPADRFPTPRAFAEALSAIGAAPVSKAKSIVVLPFANLSTDPENEYFSDGLTEDIITDLSHIGSVRVISRNSAMCLKGTSKDTRTIGRQLDVQYVLEGSVRKAGNKLRVTAQLIDATDDSHLWAERYDGVLEDVFEMQETLSRAIVGALEVELSPAEDHGLSQRPIQNHEAYDFYLMGRYHWHKFTQENISTAIQYFQRAIDLDPGFALAHGGLAASYFTLSGPGVPGLPARVGIPKAKAAAEKALLLDPNTVFAGVTLAFVYAWFELDWDSAEPILSRIVAANPRSSEGHEAYAMYLSMKGSHDEALRHISAAIELDPLWPLYYANASEILYMARRFDEAPEYCRRALELDRDFVWAHIQTAMAQIQTGDYHGAVDRLERHADTRYPRALQFLGYGYGIVGRSVDARRVLASLEDMVDEGLASEANLALVCLGLGEEERALDHLEAALEERPIASTALAYAKVEPAWDRMRGRERFQQVVDRIGKGLSGMASEG